MNRLPIVTGGLWLVLGATRLGAAPQVDLFLMETPKGEPINQASDLCYGSAAGRTGLWTCCDRNGLATAGQIYRFDVRRDAPAQQAVGRVRAAESFVIVPPEGAWKDFAAAQRGISAEAIEDVRRRIVSAEARGDEPYLDLEAMTIGADGYLYVVTEEPWSTILKLRIEGAAGAGVARLVGLYAYHERPAEQGTAKNDGLEGLAWSGHNDRFYFCEEGTRDAKGQASALLFFLDPRLGVGQLDAGELHIANELSHGLTDAVRRLRTAPTQTLNGLCVLPGGEVLALDRNGGVILKCDPKTPRCDVWLNLYDMDGVDLRRLLARVPHDRHMPYVSMEGLAVDPSGDLWLVDDPAIPEGFRESTLIRVRGVSATSRPASAPGSQ